jgi:drug/metabolite transporter (DMT)-like permease
MIPFAGELSSLLVAILWTGTSISFSEASFRVGSVHVNITRMLFAWTYLVVTILVMGFSISLSASQIFYLAISGFIGLVFGDTFLFKAYQHVGARIGMLIMSLAPPISALFAFLFLNENLSLIGLLGILITVGGIAIVVLQREEKPTSKYKISKIGIFYAFLGAVGQGVGLIFAKLAFNQGDINGFVATYYRISVAILLFYPIYAYSTKQFNPFKAYYKNKKALTFTFIGSIIGPYLGITFSMIAISYTKVGIASTIMAAVPILMLPFSKYYYKEKLSWKSIMGAVLAVGGIAILFLD